MKFIIKILIKFIVLITHVHEVIRFECLIYNLIGIALGWITRRMKAFDMDLGWGILLCRMRQVILVRFLIIFCLILLFRFHY